MHYGASDESSGNIDVNIKRYFAMTYDNNNDETNQLFLGNNSYSYSGNLVIDQQISI